VTNWSPSRLDGADSIFSAPPGRIKIDTVPNGGGLSLGTVPGALRSVHRFASARVEGADALALNWSTGFSGLVMSLHTANGGLEGTLTPFWDFPREERHADVRATRVPCDAPFDTSTRAQDRYPRSLFLADGRLVSLGSQLEAGPTSGLKPALASRFGDADSIAVRVRADGNVRGFDVFFADSLSTQLRDRMIEWLGNPTSGKDLASPTAGQLPPMVMWSSRTTTIVLMRSTDRNGHSFAQIRFQDR
jgi:hypothetical protein